MNSYSQSRYGNDARRDDSYGGGGQYNRNDGSRGGYGGYQGDRRNNSPFRRPEEHSDARFGGGRPEQSRAFGGTAGFTGGNGGGSRPEQHLNRSFGGVSNNEVDHQRRPPDYSVPDQSFRDRQSYDDFRQNDRQQFGQDHGQQFRQENGQPFGQDRGERRTQEFPNYQQRDFDQRRGYGRNSFDRGRGRGSYNGNSFQRGPSNGFGARGHYNNQRGGSQGYSDRRPSYEQRQFPPFEATYRGGYHSRPNASYQQNELTSYGAPRAPCGWMPSEANISELYRMDQEHVRDTIYDEDSVISQNGTTITEYFESWDATPLNEVITNIVKTQCRYKKPRNIQSAFIPLILKGKDIIAQAETGSGKTAAVALPVISQIIDWKRDGAHRSSNQPFALMLVPTRELTEQVFNQFRKFSEGTSVKICRLYGQMATREAASQIQIGCDVLIGTIGKVNDFLNRGIVDFKKIRFFILDEFDRMMEANNMQELNDIKLSMNPDHQSILMSATVNLEAREVANRMVRKSQLCQLCASTVNKRIIHHFIHTPYLRERNKVLRNLLRKEIEKAGGAERMPRTLIFVARKKRANILAIELCEDGIPALSISGDNAQDARLRIVRDFESGKARILIGTDVCERGLDINDLDIVINFDLPASSETYAHRIGRTGRKKQGNAFTLVDQFEDDNVNVLKHIVQYVHTTGSTVPDWLESLASGRFGLEVPIQDLSISNSNPVSQPQHVDSRKPTNHTDDDIEDW